MIGPLATMAAVQLRRRRPARRRAAGASVGQIVIGTALGLYFTPVVAREVVSYWPLLLIAGLFAILLGACGRLGAEPRRPASTARTAFFASVAGGAAEMTILGERYGARPDRVALAQSLRILAVVIVVPFALTYSGVHGSDAYLPAPLPADWTRLALLLGLATLAGFLVNATGVPNAFMFGPLAAVIALTVNEVHFSSMPHDPVERGTGRARLRARRALRAPLVRARRRASSAAVLASVAFAMVLVRRVCADCSPGHRAWRLRPWCSPPRPAGSRRCASPPRCCSSACRW